jgi:hypothetical protein
MSGQLTGTHAQDFIVSFSHFLASFKNRQGQGPDLLNFKNSI